MEEESLGIRRAQRGKSADRPGERPVRSMRARSDRPGGGVDVEHVSQSGECGCLQPRVRIQEEHKLRAAGSPASVAPVRKASVPRRVDHLHPGEVLDDSKLRSGHALSTTRMDTPGMPTKGSTQARRHWRLLYATTTTSTESMDMSSRSQAIAGGASAIVCPASSYQIPQTTDGQYLVVRVFACRTTISATTRTTIHHAETHWSVDDRACSPLAQPNRCARTQSAERTESAPTVASRILADDG